MAATALMCGTFCFFMGCTKDSEMSNSPKSLKMSGELIELYKKVPTFDLGKVSLINGDILQFETEEHFQKVYEALLEQYDAWTEIFLKKYDTDDEDKLDEIVEQLGFNDCTPLLMFEDKYGITDNNLRAIGVMNENTWLAKGATGTPPIDKIVNCPREQTLYSKHREVCIGDTIYQMRSGCQVIIPISEIKLLPEIRAAVTVSDLEKLLNQFPRIGIIKSENACFKSSHSMNGTQYHPEVGEKKFTWSYNYGGTFGHRCKTTVTMTNYKKKKGKWKKDNAICALALHTRLYSYMIESESCSSAGSISKDLGNANKHYSKTKVKYTRKAQTVPDYSTSMTIGPVTFYPYNIVLEKLHTDPEESYIQCRHQGWTYQFNAATGNPE